MEYTINRLAKMSGTSVRTLHYYDEIGLLSPARAPYNHYRIYNETHVDALQEILLLRELDVSLDEIRSMLQQPGYDRHTALQSHLSELYKKKEQIDLLIANVKKTIQVMEGETIMKDKEKFEGFKQKLIDENEKKYGDEIRRKFGDESIDASNKKVKGMTPEQYKQVEQMTEELNNAIAAAFKSGDPAGELARKACGLHKEWLCRFWPDGAYGPEAHAALAQGYVDDPRFTAYYDKIAPGCTVFLRDAIRIFCGIH